MLDVQLYDGMNLIKEGSVLLKENESGRMFSRKDDIDGGVSSAFFCPKEDVQRLYLYQDTNCWLQPHRFYDKYPQKTGQRWVMLKLSVRCRGYGHKNGDVHRITSRREEEVQGQEI